MLLVYTSIPFDPERREAALELVRELDERPEVVEFRAAEAV